MDDAAPDRSPAPYPARQDSSAVDADALIADITTPPIGRTAALAIAIHVVVILLTSIHFIYLCAEHHTLDPRSVIRQRDQQARDAKLEAERKAARERIRSEQVRRKKADGRAVDQQPPDELPGPNARTPKVIQNLEATSNQRPTESDVELDELDLP